MNIVRHRTPDTGWAWVISVSCATINGLTFGLIRSSGVFFFYLRHEFEVSRQVASWPFALCTSCTYLTGPITGFLISYFHLRTIVFVGILLSSLGFGLCFFTHHIEEIVVLVGVVHGFGVGLSFMQTPVILAQYFDKYHATATAISYAGGTVGSFIFPPLIELFIKEYGLRGSFLIIGAILLNGLPCAMLLRPPIPDYSTNSVNGINSSQDGKLSSRLIRGIHHRLRRRRNDRWLFLRKTSIDLFAERLNSKSNLSLDKMGKQRQTVATISWDNFKTYKKQVQSMTNDFQESEVLLLEVGHYESGRDELRRQEDKSLSQLDPLLRQNDGSSDSTSSRFNTKHRYSQTNPLKPRGQFIKIVFRTVTNPMYIILLITHVSFQWAWMTYQVVIFDFGMDQDLSRDQSLLILIMFAFCDLIGRIISGWVADKQIIKKNHIVSICILIIGFLILLTSMIDSYRFMVVLTILLGLTCGIIIVLFNLLTMEYVGLENLPVALGVSAFCVGFSSLFRPYIIGLFRDVIGSYDGLFQFVSTLSLIAALLWLMEPFAILSFKRKTNKRIVIL